MLKLSDKTRQGRLEAVFEQLGWEVTGRSVSERDSAPPMLTYWLMHPEPDADALLAAIPGEFGLAREPDLRLRGKKGKLILTVRQLVPTPSEQGAPREWGR